MNARFHRNITPGGNLTTTLRAAQEEARQNRVAKGPGVTVRRNARGTFIRVQAPRQTTSEGGSSVPLWG